METKKNNKQEKFRKALEELIDEWIGPNWDESDKAKFNDDILKTIKEQGEI